MSTRISFGALVALIALVGCQPGKPQPSPQPVPTPTVRSVKHGDDAAKLWDLPDTDKPMIVEPKPTAAALAEKAQDYTHQLEPLLAKRAAAGAQPASATNGAGTGATAPGGEPSHVQFGNVSQARPGQISETPAANPANPAVAPAADPNTPGATSPSTPPSVTLTPPRSDVPFNKDSPAVNTPLIVGQPRPLPATDDLANKFAKQVKDFPQDIAGHLDWQLLQFLQGQSVPQLQTLTPLPGEDREMLSALFDGLTNFRNGLRADNNTLLSRKIRPLLELSDRLRTQAELAVPTLALCTDVKGFGVYEPIEPCRFEAGKEHRVIVYCEVENFASFLDEQKRWSTKLTQEVVLYTEQNGLEVWRDKTLNRPIIDYSRNRRHDFFIVKMIRLPANLTIGRYLLKVTVVDQQVNRVAENTVPILIVAQ